MSRSYQHISNYENEILELKSQGLTLKEIGEKLGFTRKQVHNFICRYNEKQRKAKVGIAIRAKGRPLKDYEVTEDMKINELKYIYGLKDKEYTKILNCTSSNAKVQLAIGSTQKEISLLQ